MISYTRFKISGDLVETIKLYHFNYLNIFFLHFSATKYSFILNIIKNILSVDLINMS